MGMHYEQLTWEERATVMVLKACGRSARYMAHMQHHSHPTITGSLPGLPSDPVARRRRQLPLVTTMTALQMWPDETQRTVFHDYIYNCVRSLPKCELHRDLIACLRRAKDKRMSRGRGEDRKVQLPDLICIHVRPPRVNDLAFPGHWERDLIKGASTRSAVRVLVERSSRLVLIKLADATAALALEASRRKLRSIVEPMHQTLTFNQGQEMARQVELTIDTGVMVYFCDLRSSWQRGPCENTNGLICQYVPKGTDLSAHSQPELHPVLID